MHKKEFLLLFLCIAILASFVLAGTDITSLRAQYDSQKAKSEAAHQVWLDCLNCYVADRDDCPLCVPLEETDMAEARKLSAIEDELRDAESAEEEKKAANQPAPPVSATSSSSGVHQVSTSDLSGKSIEQLSNIRMQLYNSPKWQEYTGNFDTSQFEQYMKPVWDMRMKGLDDVSNRIDACYDACSGEKFQRGGGGQACVQPCLDKADAENKKVLQEIDRLEKAAYIKDITSLQAALEGSVPEVKGKLPEGPKVDTRTDRGLTQQGFIAPSMGGYLGNAYVVRPDGTKVIPGKELYLNVDDKVITGEESKVNIIFGNAGKMNLGPNTELRVGSALLDQYYLAKGTFKTKLDWTAGVQLRIDTMNAAIFQKHTEFVVDYNETTNTTTVFLNEGELEIRSATQTINLTAGNYCTIDSAGNIVASDMQSTVWNKLGDNFLDEGKRAVEYYAWISFAVMIISCIVASVVFYRAKSKQHRKEEKKNLGVKSIVLGIFGVLLCLLPIFGFPLSITSTTLSRIQKLHQATTSSKIGYIIGLIGVVLNGSFILILILGLIVS